MAKQAEAERERRAKVIHADGELQAATKLKEAADHMAQNPVTVQLRYLQTLSEIATENNSTTLFRSPSTSSTASQRRLTAANRRSKYGAPKRGAADATTRTLSKQPLALSSA